MVHIPQEVNACLLVLWKDNTVPFFLTVNGMSPGFIVTLPFTALVCYDQNGRVSAKLSIPGRLVPGLCGADGFQSCPPGCGGARPQPQQGAALHLPPTRAVL